MKRILKCFLSLVIMLSFLSNTNIAFAADTYLDLEAKSAILIEQFSGKVLYAKDENTKMYPASMTKVLTALVALDYLEVDELVRVGSEINQVPIGSSLAGHVNGEYITVKNLIRGLIIPSGNESANVVALAVAKKAKNADTIKYSEAEEYFSQLMNEKARKLGANDSNFVNPHGYHDPNHYSTAHDIALICRSALENELIKRIAGEVAYVGNSAEDNLDKTLKTVTHDWKTHNNLLIEKNDYYYPYATGIKTGFTDEAGSCVSASATKEGKNLIAVVMFSSDSGRWVDCAKLFNFGFEHFNYEYIQHTGDIVGSAQISNNKLGDASEINLIAEVDVIEFLGKDELSKIQSSIVFDENYLKPADANSTVLEPMLMAPIAKGAILGAIKYSLNEKVIFTGNVLAENDVEKRELQSDISYYLNEFKKTVFSFSAIPYWASAILVIVVIVWLMTAIRRRKAARRRNIYNINRRRKY